jgi:D-arabinose 1-dehydrogenase-like Zn-dependent alcohol dehydrogenase
VTLLALLLGLAVFIGSLKLMGAAGVGSDAVRVARATVATMSAADLSDDEKEVQVRRAAARMLRTFLSIAFIATVALAAPAALVWAGSAAGFYTLDQVAELATSVPFLLGSTVAAILLWIALERLG